MPGLHTNIKQPSLRNLKKKILFLCLFLSFDYKPCYLSAEPSWRITAIDGYLKKIIK